MTEPYDRPETIPATAEPVTPANTPVTTEPAPPAAFVPLSEDSQKLIMALSVAGTKQGQAHLDGLVKAASAQNPAAGDANAELVKSEFIKWAVGLVASGAHATLDRIPVLGPALDAMAETAIHSSTVEAFLHTQLDVIIGIVYRTIKNNGFFARIANWIGHR